MKNYMFTISFYLGAMLGIAACGPGGNLSSTPEDGSTAVDPVVLSFCEQGLTQTDCFTAATSINGQNGWANAGGFDERVENVGAVAQTGQNVSRHGRTACRKSTGPSDTIYI